MRRSVDPDELRYALYYYDNKLSRNENSVNHHSFGTLQLYKQNVSQAKYEYKKSVDANPRNIGARNDLAVLQYKTGDTYSAEKELSTALVC